MSFTTFGNNKLNINTTTAKGLEKVIGLVANFVISARDSSDKIIYGKNQLTKKSKASKIQKALDKGLMNVFKELSKIDYCNILNYTVNNAKFGDKSFNPNKPPSQDASNFAKTLWKIQRKAFDYQKNIDKFYGLIGSSSNINSVALQNLISSSNLLVDELLDQENGLENPEMKRNFPEITLASNFLRNTKQKINSFQLGVGTINNEEFRKFLDFVQKIRQTLIVIQSLNTPANLISNIDTWVGGKIAQDFQKLNAIIDTPANIIPVFKSLIKLFQNLVSIGKSILKYISVVSAIVRIAILIIRIVSVLKAFIAALPLFPVPAGAGVTFSDIYQEKLQNQLQKKLFTRLNQINIVLDLMVIFVTSFVAAMNEIILILRGILLNIQSCDQADEDLIAQLDSAIKEGEDVTNKLQDFLNRVDDANSQAQRKFGNYTIEIVSEELVDEGIKIKRRYGIARGSDGNIAAQSQPTFASLDLIIINEVRALLSSKGLVDVGVNDLSPEQIETMMNSMKFLDTQEIDISDLEQLNTEFEDSTGLISFVDNLPGGKKLRKTIRKKLLENSKKLGTDLKSIDQNSKYTAGLEKQNQETTKRAKIGELEDEKKDLQKQMAAAALNPYTAAALIPKIAQKIKKIDADIQALKSS